MGMPIIIIGMRIIKYPINENYFKKIDTERKAYFLGLLFADGGLDKAVTNISITLKDEDLHILEELRKDIQPTKPFYKAKSGPYTELVFTNKYLYADLIKHGCIPNKTFLLQFPKLKKDLVRHFIRGYFDGDGCLTGSYRSNYSVAARVKKWTVSFVSTLQFCESLQKRFKKLGVASRIDCRWPERNNTTRTLTISGRVHINILLDWLYKDATIYLNRKHNKYLEFVADSKQAKELKSVCRKFSQAQADEIRKLYKTGEYTYLALAKKYNVCRDTILRLISLKQYK
jgi:intein/homing endonuclease